MFPAWLHITAILALLLGVACALVVAMDVARHPQQMRIMDIVWPVTCLFGTVATVWLYFRHGRLATAKRVQDAIAQGDRPPAKAGTPFPLKVAKGALHCGSGCMIGDVLAEWLVFFFPVVATLFGWHWLFEEKIFAAWVVDYLFAFLLGIVFQYFTIVPMRQLPPVKGVVAAVKADALSLSAWQVGMYGFMAFAQFVVYRRLAGHVAEVATPEFWFAMQLAMIAGFATAYPVNWWLIRAGLKEAM